MANDYIVTIETTHTTHGEFTSHSTRLIQNAECEMEAQKRAIQCELFNEDAEISENLDCYDGEMEEFYHCVAECKKVDEKDVDILRKYL